MKKRYEDMTPEEKFQERITWHDDDIVFLGKPTVTEEVVEMPEDEDDDTSDEDIQLPDEPVATNKTPIKP